MNRIIKISLISFFILSCGNSIPNKMTIFNEYANEAGINADWNSKKILFILRPNSGCISCYKSLLKEILNPNKIWSTTSKVLFVGQPLDYPINDLKNIRDIYGQEVFIDSIDVLNGFNLDALSSGYFYQTTKSELNFEYFYSDSAPKLDSLILTL